MIVMRSKVTGALYGPFDTDEKAQEWQTHLSALVPKDDLMRHPGVWEPIEVTYVESAYDIAPVFYRKTFGPGKLESIELSSYLDGAHRVKGTYTIYCGWGNHHDVQIDTGAITEAFNRAYDDAAKAHPTWDAVDMLYEAVSILVDEEVGESWFDPCDVQDDEEPLTADEADALSAKVDHGVHEALYCEVAATTRTCPRGHDWIEGKPYHRTLA